MKKLTILMVAIIMVSLADAEMTLRIVDNSDGTCGIASTTAFMAGDDMYFVLTTEYHPPYPSGGYVPGEPIIVPAGTIIAPTPAREAGVPLPPGEDGVWGYIGDPMGNPAPPGKYIDGIQVWLGAYVKLYKISANWDSVTILKTCVIGSLYCGPDCLIGGISHPAEHDDWVLWNKPSCWCYARQCRGDINGKKTGPFRVQLLDLQILAAAHNKMDSQLAKVFVNNVPGICADINHKKTGPYRVQLLDLQELSKYFNKIDAKVPTCDQPPLTTGPYGPPWPWPPPP